MTFALLTLVLIAFLRPRWLKVALIFGVIFTLLFFLGRN